VLTRKAAYLTLAGVSLIVAISLAVYIFNLCVLADSSTENIALPIWAVVIGALAVVSFLVFFLRRATLRSLRT